MTSKDLLSNLASYGIGRQDYILNPLGFISLLGSEILQKRSALAATPDAALRMKSLAKGMADLHGAIDAARVPLRFWVGLQSFNSLRNQEYLSAHRDEQLAKRIQTMMFAAFNPFEVISYVKNVAPSLLPFISAEQGGTCGRAACSLWFLSSLIEFYVLYRAYKRWKKVSCERPYYSMYRSSS